MEFLNRTAPTRRLLLLAVCVTCATGGGEVRAGSAPVPGTEARSTAEPRWRAEIGRTVGLRLGGAADVVAVSTRDRRLSLLRLGKGEVLWEQRLEAGVQGGVRIEGGAVYGVTDFPDGKLFCRESGTGRLRWEYQMGEAWDAPLFDGRKLFAASLQGHVVCRDLATGDGLWERDLDGIVRSPLFVRDSLLYVPTVSNRLFALNVRTGETVWASVPGGSLYGAPCAFGGLIWTVSYDGVLTGWQPGDGTVVVRYRLEPHFRAGPVADAGGLILVTTGGRVIRMTGFPPTSSWERPLHAAAELTPTLDGESLWLPLRDGRVVGLMLETGEPIATFSLEAPAGTYVLTSGERLLIGGGQGDLYCFPVSGLNGETELPLDAKPSSESRARPGRGSNPANDLLAPRPFQWTPRTPITAAAQVGFARPWAAPGGSGLLHLQRGLASESSSRGGGLHLGAAELWAASWVIGAGLALWFQDTADDAYQDYRRYGNRVRREDALDRAERYDRYALMAWAGSEACFLMALYNWLWDEGGEGDLE